MIACGVPMLFRILLVRSYFVSIVCLELSVFNVWKLSWSRPKCCLFGATEAYFLNEFFGGITLYILPTVLDMLRSGQKFLLKIIGVFYSELSPVRAD